MDILQGVEDCCREGLTEKLYFMGEFTFEISIEIKNDSKFAAMYSGFLDLKNQCNSELSVQKERSSRIWKSNSGASYCHQMKTKNKLVDFIVKQQITNSSLIGNEILIVTNNTEAYEITSNNCILIPELKSNHKEADSRMMFYVKHARRA